MRTINYLGAGREKKSELYIDLIKLILQLSKAPLNCSRLLRNLLWSVLCIIISDSFAPFRLFAHAGVQG